MAYSYYKEVKIDYTKVAATLTNFPIALVIASDNDLRTVANGGHVQNTASGGASGSLTVPADLVFSPNSNGSSPYDFEIETYSATTGQIVAHIRIPSLSNSVDTTFYIVYGDSGVTVSQENVTGVWDANYKGVWHLSETSGTHYDSTSNNNDGTPTSLGAQGTAQAKMGGADDFDANNSYINVGSGSTLDLATSGTIEAWAYGDGWGETGNGMLMYRGVGTGTGYQFYYRQASTSLALYDGSGTSVKSATGSIALAAWYHCVVSIDSGTVSFFINGASSGGGTMSLDAGGTFDAIIGNKDTPSSTFDGQLDEVRVSSIARSVNWCLTQYNNQVDASIGAGKFLKSIGSEVAIGGGVSVPVIMHHLRQQGVS